MSVRKRVVMTACLLVCVMFMLEGVLQLAALASPRVRVLLAPPWSSLRSARGSTAVEPFVPDAALGHRPNPGYPGHDARGFRNPTALPTANIVALGDSHTYGANVEPEQTWTRVLAESLGEPVYNMAFGGWGPVHSLYLLPEALELHPELILVGVYSGNDFYDCYDLVHEEWILNELVTTDSDLLARIAAAEAAEPAKRRIEGIWRDLYSDVLGEQAEGDPDLAAAPIVAQPSAETEPPLGPRRLLSEYSMLYGLVRATKDALGGGLAEQRRLEDARWEKNRRRASEQPDQCDVFEHGSTRMIFTPRVRLVALDRDDPRIAEGFQIAVRALGEIGDRAAAAGARVAVVFLPTKEYVYRDLVRESGQALSPAYERLAAAEDSAWSELRAEMTSRGIAVIDATPALRAALRSGEQPYPANRDGHPTPAGHRIIARAIEEGLKSRPPAAANSSSNLVMP